MTESMPAGGPLGPGAQDPGLTQTTALTPEELRVQREQSEINLGSMLDSTFTQHAAYVKICVTEVSALSYACLEVGV